jgi:YgiT-type zinc finger domain-containing protein
MNCFICKQGQTQPGSVTVTLERGQTTIVFKHVPAHICDNCGEAYIDERTTDRLMKDAEIAVQTGVQVEVRSFNAA